MQTKFWAKLPLFVLPLWAAHQGTVKLPSGALVHYLTVKNAETRFDIRTSDGRHFHLELKRDADVPSDAIPRKVKVIGELKGASIILTDTYPSKPGGLSYCQAGEEQFLRVISTAPTVPRQTLVLKLASCRDNIELADPGLEWNGQTSTLSIHWLLGPTVKDKPEDRMLHVGPTGQVSRLASLRSS